MNLDLLKIDSKYIFKRLQIRILIITKHGKLRKLWVEKNNGLKVASQLFSVR